LLRRAPPGLPFEVAPDAKLASPRTSLGLKLTGTAVRALFMCILLVIVARVASPQNESIWSAYETPADLVRMVLGFAVGVWILVHLFMLPKDAAAYRTWSYMGLVLLPLAVVCAIAIW
jgi:hypothetical protein